MPNFILYWNDGKKETLEGKNIADAFNKHYSKGAFNSLSHYDRGDSKLVWCFFSPSWCEMKCDQTTVDTLTAKQKELERSTADYLRKNALSIPEMREFQKDQGQLIGINFALNALRVYPSK